MVASRTLKGSRARGWGAASSRRVRIGNMAADAIMDGR
jgi:hypothetical protein